MTFQFTLNFILKLTGKTGKCTTSADQRLSSAFSSTNCIQWGWTDWIRWCCRVQFECVLLRSSACERVCWCLSKRERERKWRMTKSQVRRPHYCRLKAQDTTFLLLPFEQIPARHWCETALVLIKRKIKKTIQRLAGASFQMIGNMNHGRKGRSMWRCSAITTRVDVLGELSIWSSGWRWVSTERLLLQCLTNFSSYCSILMCTLMKHCLLYYSSGWLFFIYFFFCINMQTARWSPEKALL